MTYESNTSTLGAFWISRIRGKCPSSVLCVNSNSWETWMKGWTSLQTALFFF